MSTLRALHYSTCVEHGHTIHRDGSCVCCHKTTQPPPVRPPPKRPPPVQKNRGGRIGRPRSYDLTPREREICALLARGHTQVKVGELLGVGRANINSTVQRSMSRIGATKTWELFHYVTGRP